MSKNNLHKLTIIQDVHEALGNIDIQATNNELFLIINDPDKILLHYHIKQI